ncbi:MAG TPA: glycosyltransferase family 4 protein [Candidatus Dormibacteraeota bacterium]|nr:glycosyltransferase family 4 protein [Candidatus Dormibacteraeota bacterium]
MKAGLPKRILMTADTVGGVWQYAIELCQAVARSGTQVYLATMGAPLTPGQRQEAASLSNTEVYESRYKLEWMDSPWSEVAAAGEWLLGLEAELNPDLVHLNGYSHAALPWEVPKLVVAHSCVLSWWQAVKGANAPPEWERYRDRVREGLRSADLVIAPSRAMLADLRRCYGELAKVRVISNGRSPSEGVGQPKEKLILSAGRLWDEAKNVRVLRDVAPLLPWPVYLAGEQKTPFESRPQSKVVSSSRDCCAEGRQVRCLGRLESADLAEWLHRAAIYVLPAKYEPFGLSILEAGLAHCALVLGDIPSLREIWSDAALYVPPNDGSALRKALEDLIGDERKREELGQRAYERAGYFTPERMADNYLAAYADLVQRRLQHRNQEVMCA